MTDAEQGCTTRPHSSATLPRAETLVENATVDLTDFPPLIPISLENEDATSAPLPTLPMIVLSIMMLGEFLSSNVSTPFLLFMVKGFGTFDEEPQAAFRTGMLVAVFFIAQFLTSLIWATIADRFGRRIVLFSSLLGSAITCGLFGISTNLTQAMMIRSFQGAFAGSVGVAKGSVPLFTNARNEGRAYAVLGFCWGFGGILGPIIGGTFESPAEKWPQTFGKIELLVKLPYLMPCVVASMILFIGAFLACFLGPNGEPPRVSLWISSPEKPSQDFVEEFPTSLTPLLHNRPLTPRGSLRRTIPRKPSRRLRNPSRDPAFGSYTDSVLNPSSSFPTHLPGTGTGIAMYRTFTASSQMSGCEPYDTMGDASQRSRYSTSIDTSSINISERLLLANENAVNHISDLWVAAVISSDPHVDDDTCRDSEAPDLAWVDSEMQRGRESNRNSQSYSGHGGASRSTTRRILASTSRTRQHRPPSHRPSLSSITIDQRQYGSPGFTFAPIPSVPMNEAEVTSMGPNLTPIIEARPLSLSPDGPVPSRLHVPLFIIVQYGLLALHTTTHDQVFLSYLITEYEDGGLNLNAVDFAQLIGIMGFAQIFYQFLLYPYLVSPRGQLSHLTMLRLGTVMFILSYLTVVIFRSSLAGPDTSSKIFLMTALTISTMVRYCGTTFTFTSISILLNYMSPPESVGFANGLAQSVVSLGRFVGPMLGGWIWSFSVQDNPSGYPVGFMCCSAVCIIALFHSLWIS